MKPARRSAQNMLLIECVAAEHEIAQMPHNLRMQSNAAELRRWAERYVDVSNTKIRRAL